MMTETSSLSEREDAPLKTRAVAADTMFGEWRRYLDFVRRPVLPDAAHTVSGGSVLGIARMWALDVVLMGILLSIAGLIVMIGIDLPENALSGLSWGPEIIAAVVIVAPIVEETGFRGWLSGRPGHILAWAVFLLTGAVLSYVARATGTETGAASYIALAVMLALIVGALYYFRKAPAMGWFKRLFPLLFWLSTLAFALVHLWNYTEGSLAYLLPFVVPQFVAGSIFGYVRVHYGLWASILTHALHNGLAVALVLSIGEAAT
ncbi:CPBP family intramembrane glutamic endopeptidase [Qipengyuania atrilutea]|uniref:CPBP family intramembrane metalloprotease n=1 Tax=Qipengyuania atrilutea TaxID=2744473 RepID=A0A850H5W0_9SPHN|nr:CPBP family intramembrane glutamic endopeptidase [Actirhodobacter atriluteus]NVD45248.1 CPBP family intramembrane metalloprotease [Actirhodobacter atriluteus]